MGIKEEITKIAVEQGYEGAKPKSIAQAIDALTDTLAGEDVKSGRSVVDAIRKYAPYVGTGGGTKRVELFNETVTTESYGPNCGEANLAYTGDITADPLVVSFDGTEYELPRSEAEGLMGKTVTYGTPLTEDGPDFSTYPLAIKSGPNAGEWRVYTKTAGTHTIAAYTEQSSGGGFEPRGKWGIDSGQSGIDITSIAVYLNDPESGETSSACIYENGLQAASGYAGPGSVACGLYVSLNVQAPSVDVADKLTVVRHGMSGSEELPSVRKRASSMFVYFVFQVPENAPAIGETLAVTTLDDEG